jgi:O-antigen/teichoic acid export membrane protein
MIASPPPAESAIQRRMLRGAASNYVGRFTGLIIWFFFTPFVLHSLGAAEYGLWVVVGSVVGYGYIFNLGIGAALVKYVAEAGAHEAEETQQLVATGLVLYTMLGLACFGVGLFLAPLLPSVLHLPPDEQSTATLVIILMGAEVGLALPCTTGTSVLQGLQRYHIVNVVTTGATVATVVGMGIALLLGGGVVGMVAVTLPITLATQVVSTWFIQRIAPELRFGWRGARRGLVRPILSFSGPVFVMQIAEVLQRKTDELVIAAFLLISDVTPYSLARRLADITRRLTDQFVRVLLPLASELHASNNPNHLKELYTAGTRLSLALLLPMTCSLVVLGGPILSVWVGSTYAQYEPLVRILAIAALASTSQAPAASILKGIARHRPLAISAICSGVANLVLSIGLIQPLGVTGVALGTLIPTLVESFAFVLPYSIWVLRIPLAQIMREIAVPAFVPAALMTLVLYAGLLVLRAASVASLALVISAGCLTYLVVYLNFAATHAERELCRRLSLGALRVAAVRLRR